MNAVTPKSRTHTRIKQNAMVVPQNLTEANRAVKAIGVEQRAIDAAVRACEAEIAKLKEKLEAKIAPHLEKRKVHFDGLFAYASVHKAELTVESKTVVLTAGKFLWRYTPPAVLVEDDQKMIDKLKGLDLSDYVRTIEELDREALLRDRTTLKVAGLSFTQREEFVVVPDGIDAKVELKKARTIDASQIS